MAVTFKADYFDGATGLHTQLATAFAAGYTNIYTTNAAAITAALKVEAAKGNKSFVINVACSYLPEAMRLEGDLLKAYLDGCISALSEGNIYTYECVPSLNTGSNTAISIDLTFTF